MVLEVDVITDPVPPNTDCPTPQDILPPADHGSENTAIHSDTGQPDLNPIAEPGVIGMPTSVSPSPDTFWYNFVEPLPIDLDLASLGVPTQGQPSVAGFHIDS